MAIGDDFEIQNDKDVRYIGSGSNYTVLQFHRWLQDLSDDAASASDDFLDITRDTPSDKSFDTIINLINSYNIDDVAAQHLYGGSIIQANGDVIYDGIQVLAPAGMRLEIVQNGNIITPNFWTTGLNDDAPNGISHQFMVKVRTGGSDIDGRRLLGLTREWGKTYLEFKINGTARGVNVMAFTGWADDLNNTSLLGTIAGYSDVVNASVGYNGIDVNNNGADEYYYSEWDRGSRTINQFYERMKWLSVRAQAESECADTGTNYALGDGTIDGQAQSFAVGTLGKYLTRVQVSLKKVGAPTGTLTAKLYAHSGTFGSASVPTGAALATSVNFNVADLTTSYQVVEIGFTTQYLTTASTNYVLALEYTGGDGSNYVHVQGDSTGTHAGNRSEDTGSWAASAGSDLYFSAFMSPDLYGFAAERFRGITHEIVIDTPTGTFDPVERVTWSGGAGIMLAIDSVTAGTKLWIQLTEGIAPTNNQTITGADSSATCLVNITVTERTVATPFCGASTGSSIIGAYGFGMQASDLSASDKVFDLTNTQYQAPNYVTFTVGGIVSGEDYVLVGPNDGGSIDLNQFTLDGALTGAAVTAVVVNEAIPADTPSTGSIRIQRANGAYTRHPYSAYNTGTKTFTITSHDFSSNNAANAANTFISYIDKLAASTSESFTAVYTTDRSLYIRVRDGGVTPIKTFETTGTLGSAGGSATAVRTSDA